MGLRSTGQAFVWWLLLAGVAHAAPFTFTITSGEGSFPGKQPAAFGNTASETLDLTPDTPTSLPIQQFTNFRPVDVFPLTEASTMFVQTVAVNGAATSVTRTASLVLENTPNPCDLLFSLSPVTVTTDFGPLGKVDVPLMTPFTLGVPCSGDTPTPNILIVVPGTTTPVLLHDVPFSIDPFGCYKTKPVAKFTPVTGVHLIGLEDVLVDVKKPRLLCAPADTTADGIADATTHLEAYQVKLQKGQAKHTRRLNLTVATQLGPLVLDTVKLELLLVPTSEDPTTTPPPPNPISHEVDHFECYKAKLSKGQPKLGKNLQITVGDEFRNPAKRVALRKVTHLCVPTNKNGEGTKHPNHLLCFKAKPTKRRCDVGALVNGGGGCKKEEDCGGTNGQTTLCALQTKFAKQIGLHTANQFDPEQLDATKEDEVCLTAFLAP
jgi:hypothetical protein